MYPLVIKHYNGTSINKQHLGDFEPLKTPYWVRRSRHVDTGVPAGPPLHSEQLPPGIPTGYQTMAMGSSPVIDDFPS